jgi:hypothetical protein
MSHFLTFVIINREEADVAQKAHELLYTYFAGDLADILTNPKLKYDGFIIGGRYDQQIFGAAPMYNLSPDEFEKRYGMDVVKAENNIRPASEVPKELVPYAIVTPQGEWFDCENKDRESWRSEAEELLKIYDDCLVVAVDCHC